MEVSLYRREERGGAFFLIFILFTVLIGLPLLIAEFMIGRSTQKQAVGAFKSIAPNTGWHWIGRLGVGTCFILLSFYSVVGGWVFIYLFRGVTGQLITPDKITVRCLLKQLEIPLGLFWDISLLCSLRFGLYQKVYKTELKSK